MKRKVFYDLGRAFDEWYEEGRVKFVYGTEGKGLEREIKHISALIDCIKKKKGKSLENG